MNRSAPLKRSQKPIPRRKRPKQRRATPRRSGRVRDEAYLARVRELDCYSCGHPAPSEADHMGPRPYGRKASDDTAVPMCRLCHRARTDGKLMYGVSDEKGRISRSMDLVHKDAMAEFCQRAIRITRERLGYTPSQEATDGPV